MTLNKLTVIRVSLKDLVLRNQYRSDRHNLLQDFYIPCLSRSVTYDRAVGFFSSTSLALVAQGLTYFIQAKGRMRLVASPHLSVDDIAAIEKGLKQKDEAIAESIVRELEKEFEQVVSDRLACLAWLLSKGFLDIKLAVHLDLYGQGIYHQKLGVFTDREGNQVVFSGSANESANALRNNFECIDVFQSWRNGDDERILEKLEDFQRLWDNQTPNLEVMDFPDAAQRSLLKRCPVEPPLREWVGEGVGQWVRELKEGSVYPSTHAPTLPLTLQLRPYQQQAIANWFANHGRGTLKMATGSGKTITALAIAAELYRKSAQHGKPLQGLLIVCPYRHLVTQWVSP